MVGIGTIVNILAVVIGSLIGLKLKNGIKDGMKKILTHALGLVVIFIGLSGALEGLLIIDEGKIKSANIFPMIISLFLGSFLGQLMDIHARTEKLGLKLKNKFSPSSSNKQFVEGFVSTTLMICVGAMAIIGSFKDALELDPSILFAKSAIDLVGCMIFASIFGVGVLFSAIPLGLYQGLLTALAFALKVFITDNMLFYISYVGSILIFTLGVNLLFDKDIKVSNMIPCVVIAALFGIF